ncbi:MAG: UvrD-helicase domain-containing protein [Lachnospiraceae bacterium]|nr:UvrD-helicase domain-containing protein [Lachnospiraceae bacterium]
MFDLNTLNEPQREAVLHDKGPLLILAGAGSGKTRVITHRIAYLIQERGVSPFQILAITFTNKAAAEMKERVGRLLGEDANNVWVSTFHSTCVRILRRYCEHIGYDRNFSIYDTDDVKSLMKQILKAMNIDTKRIKEKAFINAISAAKNECIGPEEFAKHAYNFPDNKIAEVYTEYQRRLKENNAFDFDDLLFKTVELFDTCGEALEYYRSRFEYIMVDEYQDTNTAQFRLIKQLACHTNMYGEIERNLCVVGDDDQSIYKFRGADITNILNFEETFKNARVIKLEQNYRSSGNILNIANEVIAHNRGRKEKKLWTSSDAGDSVTFIQYNSDFEEARGIVEDIQNSVSEGASYKDFAILYRTNAQSRLLEERMIYRNLPYRIVGGVNFYQRKEIKDILAYLKTIANGQDALQTKRIINIPKRGIGDTTIDHVQNYADFGGISFYEALLDAKNISAVSRAQTKIASFTDMIEELKIKASGMSVSKLIEEVIETVNYYEYLSDYSADTNEFEDRRDNISSFIDKAVSYEQEADNEATLSDFLSEVALVADIDSVSSDENCILLMTLHSAKGLEFDNVYMCGMEERLFPSAMCMESEAEIEEERRLCYVGITRARKKLTLTAAKQRMLHGETSFNLVSRFVLQEIPRFMLSIKGHAHESYMRAPKNEWAKNNEPAPKKNETLSRDFYLNRSSNSGLSFTGSTLGHSGSKAGIFNSAKTTDPYKDLFKVREIAPATTSSLDYKVGDRVKHIRFGEGTVKDITKGSKDYEITVDFNGNTKKMLASFAKLQKI